MLQEILDYIHNYFIKEVYRGSFKIESGSLVVDFLKENQYFKVVGSVFNDGVHVYSDQEELHDETFDGEVWALAIPQAVLDVADEIKAWIVQNGDVVNSPFQSESFGGYSYNKGSGGSRNGSGQINWQNIFGYKLNAYRKIS